MQQYKNKKILRQLYAKERKSTRQIAKILGCGHETIRFWLKKHGILIRTRLESMIGRSTRPLIERFWEKVDIRGENECWEWQNSRMGGYGAIRANGKIRYSHIVSWELHNGKIQKGLCVCHHCDNKICVNPNHLFLGTHQDNTDDMMKKGRSNKAKGEDVNSAKLTEKQVLKIRAKYSTGDYTQKQLANKYSVSQVTIGHIVNRKIWKHLLKAGEKNDIRRKK